MRIPGSVGGVLVTAAVVVGIGLAGTAPAAADCVGPSLSVTPSTAAPGEWVTVVGRYFGTACNDAGPPGGRVLGAPQGSVPVSVRVGTAEKVVAEVEAGSDYSFVVDVMVPPSLGTGAGAVVATTAGTWTGYPVTAPLEVAGEARNPTDAPLLVIRDEGADGGVPWGWALGGLAVGVVAMVVVVAIVGRRTSPA